MPLSHEELTRGRATFKRKGVYFPPYLNAIIYTYFASHYGLTAFDSWKKWSFLFLLVGASLSAYSGFIFVRSFIQLQRDSVYLKALRDKYNYTDYAEVEINGTNDKPGASWNSFLGR